MKKYKWLIIILLFTALCANVFGQTTATMPFEVKKSGQGKQAIILIPGLGCSGEVWDQTVAAFEKNYTCYTLTMAGFAGVQPLPEASFANWETQIARYIRNNNIQKPIIIGHSLGGGLALAIAADYPQLIEKIIVVDALPCLSALQNPAFKPQENNDCTPMINQFTTINNEQFEQMQKSNIAGLVADTSGQKKVVSWTMQSDRKTFAGLFCDFLNTDLREKLKSIQCPALILLESPFTRIKPAIEEQYKNLKGAQLQYSPKALHFIMFDDKEWYQDQLTGFIK
ncbi:alpha/beta fold hydrolase [Chitinophaga filiformis]|uniref:Alpha/beta hydrolase n=1 Tax=Chitinophaga filiformis TaxID=104663 RepID=A0ABY4HUZ3_CHIFI|nr:alpha/beta hydrolase [Chitinophaga filiformis]UPK67612.1 alpha/beta hydrolase [Chitinophaga filiformis]